MANYVKFRRGTPDVFQQILNAGKTESDTLYFIYEEDEATGDLYLGSKLIAGGGDIIGATTLAALQDVLLNSNLSETDCLVYDISQKRWVNKPIIDILPIFVGTNGETNSVAGLVPATTGNNPNLFLRSDGKWAEVVAASETLVLQTIIGTNETPEAAIARITEGKLINKGNIVILKELIANDLYQHTSYIYDGNIWIAMDGNYSIENIYLANNLTITADIGVQKLNGAGSKTLETAGKNLKEVLDMLLVSRVLPTYIEPSISINCPEVGSYEVGTSITPTFTATFNNGSYQYNLNENTGVTISSWSATFNDKTLNSDNGIFDAVTLGDNFNKRIGVIATHTAGIAPKDNLGNVVTDSNELLKCQIQAGSKTSYSGYIKSFRYQFFGSNINPVDITSDNIRALEKREATKTVIEMTIAEGSNQIIIAVPENYNIAKIADNGAFGVDILGRFIHSVVSVAGASDGYDINYNVYVYSPDTALGANTYTISFA